MSLLTTLTMEMDGMRRRRKQSKHENGSVVHESPKPIAFDLPRFNVPLLLGLIIFRWINALLVRTQFDPDEYWQLLEPARWLVYGEGWLTWEWMPPIALRSWLHPLLFSLPWYCESFPALSLD